MCNITLPYREAWPRTEHQRQIERVAAKLGCKAQFKRRWRDSTQPFEIVVSSPGQDCGCDPESYNYLFLSEMPSN
jgi:hypothetical protein